MNSMDTEILSPLKWAGSKRFLAKRVKPLINKEIRPDPLVTELFAGSLGFSLQMQFKRVVANDLNEAIINFYDQIKQGNIPDCHTWPIDEKSYYAYRDRYNELLTTNTFTSETASILVYLNAIGFNGLYRTNLSGRFNVPFGKQSTFPLEKIERCKKMMEQIKDWHFSSKDFKQFEIPNETDLLVVDPPYANTFVNYSGNFDYDDQLALIERMASIDCPIIISNSMCPKMIKHYRDAGFKTYKTVVNRKISASSEGRKPVFEFVGFRGFSTKRINQVTSDLAIIRK